jgi:hypothetical protein
MRRTILNYREKDAKTISLLIASMTRWHSAFLLNLMSRNLIDLKSIVISFVLERATFLFFLFLNLLIIVWILKIDTHVVFETTFILATINENISRISSWKSWLYDERNFRLFFSIIIQDRILILRFFLIISRFDNIISSRRSETNSAST